MKIILTQDIKNLGEAGAVIKVKDGYARNYLIPKNFAILANRANISKVDKIKAEAEKIKLALENEFKVIVDKINETEIFFTRKADENDHLFGSVSEIDIYKSLKELGMNLNKSAVKMDSHIKALGTSEVEIVLSPKFSGKLKVTVDKEQSET